MKPEITFEAVNDTLEIFSDRVEIKRKKILGMISPNGNETLFFKDITSIDVRECSFSNGGHIQFSAAGTNEKNNKVVFGGWSGRAEMNANANAIKTFIVEAKQKLNEAPVQINNTTSTSDEILKLSKIKDDCLIT